MHMGQVCKPWKMKTASSSLYSNIKDYIIIMVIHYYLEREITNFWNFIGISAAP